METKLARPPKAGTETPLFAVGTHPGFSSAAAIMVSIHRVDGLPETDARGTRLRTDRGNWLTRRQAMELIGAIMGGLPRY